MNKKLLAAGAFSVITVLATACGSSPSTGSTNPSPSPASAGTKVAVANNAKLGQILVDDKGMTLYLFVKDTGTSSTCYDQCATFWPPFVTTAKAVAADGVTTGKFSTTARKDGSLQVTFNSHPLYFYARDAAAGETNGQGSTGFGAVWQVVSAP